MSTSLIQATVTNMINEIGELRANGVAIDSMPVKLQQVRQLLRELDADLYRAKAALTAEQSKNIENAVRMASSEAMDVQRPFSWVASRDVQKGVFNNFTQKFWQEYRM